MKLNKNVPQEAVGTVSQIQDPTKLADTIAGHLGVKLSEKQDSAGDCRRGRAA